MIDPPARRPTGATVAGVILLVLAGECLLAALASAVGAVVILIVSDKPVMAVGTAVLFGLTAGPGVPFLVVGVKALRGTVHRPIENGRKAILLGVIVLIVLAVVGGATIAAPGGRPAFSTFLQQGGWFLLGMLAAAFVNVAALILAGVLLQKQTTSYIDWTGRTFVNPYAPREHD